MGKMDEQIIVVDRGFLFDNEAITFQGLLTDWKHTSAFMHRFKEYKVTRRGDAEDDATLKQPIPYAIIRRGDEVYLYKRLSGGGEAKLFDRLSIGIGGHMNRVNDVRNWNDNLMMNFFREMHEELEISYAEELEPKIIGLINDDLDTTGVGLHHIAILMVLDVPDHVEVHVRETDELEGAWVNIKHLHESPIFDGLESWSQYAVGAL
jgi:predicted NUDIX family phosphoesterase